MFAETLAGYYGLTGDARYFERAVAALRASYTTMICPENKHVAPGNLGRMRPKDIGGMYENYAHLGYDRRAPGYIMFDWGSGGAMAATQRMRRAYGDIFIDFENKRVFGIDYCVADSLRSDSKTVSFDLAVKGKSREMKIKGRGAPKRKIELKINGVSAGNFDAPCFENGISYVL